MTLITDELVSVAKAAIREADAEFTSGNLTYDQMLDAMARAALAVAVPVVVEKCAQEAELQVAYELLTHGELGRVVADDVAKAIRSLAG